MKLDFAPLYNASSKDTFESGWVPPRRRTLAQYRLHDRLISQSRVFALAEPLPPPQRGEKCTLLWDCAKAANGGTHPPPFEQVTGSCVGQGGGRVIWTLAAVEVVRDGEHEVATLPFFLYTYGRARLLAGLRGRGDGCFGSAFADAAKQDGILPSTLEGLPARWAKPTIGWGEAVEYTWSDGAKIDPRLITKGREFLVRTTALMRSATDVRESIRAGYPVTIASNWGGQMGCQTTGDPPVLLNRRVTSWNHQMCVLAYWWHPTLGELFWVQNSWANPHGNDPAGGPPGGFWVRIDDMEYIVKQEDSWAFSQLNGFPALGLDFSVLFRNAA